jgi:hypothetical protein
MVRSASSAKAQDQAAERVGNQRGYHFDRYRVVIYNKYDEAVERLVLPRCVHYGHARRGARCRSRIQRQASIRLW